MFDVVINPLALKEYNEAALWYDEQSEGLGERFQSVIDETILLILKNPQLFNLTQKDYHEAVVDTFPYVIVYYVNERSKTVHISAIYHSSRNPKRKFRK